MENRAEWEYRMKKEHFETYEALAKKIGIAALREILPASAERIRRALEKGDIHLNSIPLALWDRAAGITVETNFSTQERRIRVSWYHPWTKENANRLSAADRVCVLKHVAKHHLDEAEE